MKRLASLENQKVRRKVNFWLNPRGHQGISTKGGGKQGAALLGSMHIYEATAYVGQGTRTLRIFSLVRKEGVHEEALTHTQEGTFVQTRQLHTHTHTHMQENLPARMKCAGWEF